jgi:hypothetical protein
MKSIITETKGRSVRHLVQEFARLTYSIDDMGTLCCVSRDKVAVENGESRASRGGLFVRNDQIHKIERSDKNITVISNIRV